MGLKIVLCFLVDEAAMWAHGAVMANHGQNCCAGSRTYVHEAIYDEFVEKCKIQAENKILGDPYDVMTMQGPQVCDFTDRKYIYCSSYIRA